MMLAEKKVFVGRFKSRGDRMREFGERAKQYTNLYVKNLPESWDDAKMEEEFSKFGEILSHKVELCVFFVFYRKIRLLLMRRQERASALVLSPSRSMTRPRRPSKKWTARRLTERYFSTRIALF